MNLLWQALTVQMCWEREVLRSRCCLPGRHPWRRSICLRRVLLVLIVQVAQDNIMQDLMVTGISEMAMVSAELTNWPALCRPGVT